MTDRDYADEYAHKCDCSEDDKCGCTYPNNLPRGFEDASGGEISEPEIIALEETAAAPLLLGKTAPDFTAEAVMADNSFKLDFNLHDYLEGSYGLIFFYPADFTFICPSELIAYNRKLNEFTDRNVRLVGISVDSKYAHQTWKKIPLQEGGIGDINFPLVADLTKEISYKYGVLSGDGTAMRASFLTDKNRVIRYQAANDGRIGRDPAETLRIIDALRFVETHGDVCPAGWRQGDKSLRPTPDGVAEYLKDMHQ